MKITEVRIKLVPSGQDKLRAFCSITFDECFVVRDLKIIDGVKGVFVAMPSRKLTERCRGCGGKNHQGASFCNACGRRLPPPRRGARPFEGARAKLHADIAHPINPDCRQRIQDEVLRAYEAELVRSKEPGYAGSSFDEFDDYDSAAEYGAEFGAEYATDGGVSRDPEGEESLDEMISVSAPVDRRDRMGLASAGRPPADEAWEEDSDTGTRAGSESRPASSDVGRSRRAEPGRWPALDRSSRAEFLPEPRPDSRVEASKRRAILPAPKDDEDDDGFGRGLYS